MTLQKQQRQLIKKIELQPLTRAYTKLDINNNGNNTNN